MRRRASSDANKKRKSIRRKSLERSNSDGEINKKRIVRDSSTNRLRRLRSLSDFDASKSISVEGGNDSPTITFARDRNQSVALIDSRKVKDLSDHSSLEDGLAAIRQVDQENEFTEPGAFPDKVFQRVNSAVSDEAIINMVEELNRTSFTDDEDRLSYELVEIVEDGDTRVAELELIDKDQLRQEESEATVDDDSEAVEEADQSEEDEQLSRRRLPPKGKEEEVPLSTSESSEEGLPNERRIVIGRRNRRNVDPVDPPTISPRQDSSENSDEIALRIQSRNRFVNYSPVEFTPIRSVEKFKSKTSKVRGRGDKLKLIDAGLSDYHNEIKNIQQILSKKPDRNKEVFLDKRKRVEAIAQLEADIKSAESVIKFDREKLIKNQTDKTIDEETRALKQKGMEDSIRQNEASIVALKQELQDGKASLEQVNKIINANLELDNILYNKLRSDLNKSAEDLSESVKEYLLAHKADRGSQRFKEVEKLKFQLQDPRQLLEEFNRAVDDVGPISYNHQLSSAMIKLPSDTASLVFKVETKGSIANAQTNRGFAKIALKKGETVNPTTDLLGISDPQSLSDKLDRNPNLIARQVISSRLDKAFGFNVLADEVFSITTGGDDIIGISAEITDGIQLMQKRDGEEVFPRINFNNEKTLKGFSDLLVLDAITGQLDRHLGNIMITPDGRVKGIDNDMAFAINKIIPDSPFALENIFSVSNKNKLVFDIDRVHIDTARAVVGMKAKTFSRILDGLESDPERVESEEAKDAAMTRFVAVQEKMKKLIKEDRKRPDDQRKLIYSSENAFSKILNEGILPGTKFDPNEVGHIPETKNYLTRAVFSYNRFAAKTGDTLININ